MKGFFRASFSVGISVCFLLSGCGGAGGTDSISSDTSENLAVVRPLMEMSRYDLKTYLLPYWDTREIYQETVVFLEGETEAPLLYAAQDILSVKNYGLNIVYEAGKDYELSEDGRLVLTPNSSIPRFPIDEYYLTEPDDRVIKVNNEKASVALEGDHWLNFFENDELTSVQISVCYRHKQAWKGPIPEGKGEKIPRFLSKLENGENVTMLFYGDSITTGAQSSGFEQVSPQADIWPVMVKKYIEAEYGVGVNYINKAVGGYTTNQGAQNFGNGVNRSGVDLLVLAFGMNDQNTALSKYKSLIQSMIEDFRRENPEGEIVLVSAMTPNYETDWYGNQPIFKQALYELEKGYNGCVCADVTSIFEYLFEAGKRFRDVTVNNVNHPNDFAARLYAQVLLKTIFGDLFWSD